MVKEGIILGLKVSRLGIQVDQAKVYVIAKLPPPIYVKGAQCFLGHAGFFRHFIKDFSKIIHLLWKFLKKDAIFKFDDVCLNVPLV